MERDGGVLPTWKAPITDNGGMDPQHSFTVIIEHDENGYAASCPALQGCVSCGDTYDEALANIREAIELTVEDMRAHDEPILTEDITTVKVAV